MNWLTTRVMRMMERVFMVRSGWLPEVERALVGGFPAHFADFRIGHPRWNVMKHGRFRIDEIELSG
jgi:hypothetical protein